VIVHTPPWNGQKQKQVIKNDILAAIKLGKRLEYVNRFRRAGNKIVYELWYFCSVYCSKFRSATCIVYKALLLTSSHRQSGRVMHSPVDDIDIIHSHK